MADYISREGLLARLDRRRSKLVRMAGRVAQGQRRVLRTGGEDRSLLDDAMRIARSVVGPVERPETAEVLLRERARGVEDAMHDVNRSRARRER